MPDVLVVSVGADTFRTTRLDSSFVAMTTIPTWGGAANPAVRCCEAGDVGLAALKLEESVKRFSITGLASLPGSPSCPGNIPGQFEIKPFTVWLQQYIDSVSIAKPPIQDWFCKRVVNFTPHHTLK